MSLRFAEMQHISAKLDCKIRKREWILAVDVLLRQRESAMNEFKIGDRSYAVAEASFGGYINRANYDRPDLSFMGFTLGATVDDSKLGKWDDPVSIWAAGIKVPKEVRSWREFDGLTLEYAGDTSWTFTCFDGDLNHCIASNRWTFKLISDANFHITWTGEIDYEAEIGKIPISVSVDVPFSGVEVSEATTAADASTLLLQYFDAHDFNPPVRHGDQFVFHPRMEQR